MNMSKTKAMVENDTPIYIKNTHIENPESYIYIGHIYSTRDKIQDKEIQRRIRMYSIRRSQMDSIRLAPKHL